jgi:hypothetical protein
MKPTLLILFSLLLPAAAHATVPTAREERNKAVALRVFEEIFNQGNSQSRTKSTLLTSKTTG